MDNKVADHDDDVIPRYALLRVILIDSYTEGRITELPIEGGTALVSGNGRGKTSLLQLIPAFFGERPDRIVKPVSNQGNFAHYYLPRSTSFIVFEYRRDAALCCSLLSSDPTGDAVEYRFVRSGYQRDWFVDEDSSMLVTSGNLPERLKLLGADFSRKMPLDQYRAIIQGKRAHGSDLKQHRRDLNDYAFCPSSRSLPHIERIVFGMFARKSNFNDLQRMIVSTVTDANTKLSLGAERKKIEVWPDAFDSYLSVMQEASRLDDIQRSYDDVLGAEQELRNIHGRFVALDQELKIRKEEKTTELQRAKIKLEESETTFKDTQSHLAAQIGELDREITACQFKLTGLNDKQRFYQEKNIESLTELLEQEQVIKRELTQLTERRVTLLDQQSNIEAKYQEILNKLKLTHQTMLTTFERERTAAQGDFQEKINTLHAESRAEEDAVRQISLDDEKILQLTIETANEAVGATREKMNNPQPDPVLVSNAEAQEENVSKFRDAQEEASKQESEALEAYSFAKEKYESAELALKVLHGQITSENDRLEALLKKAEPDENSLLHYLRLNRSDWTLDIAKVLREDLLSRTDLAPTLVAIHDSVYGLQIDLDYLSTPLAADETALQAEIEQIRTAIKSLYVQQVSLEVGLTELSQIRSTSNSKLSEMSAKTSLANKALESEQIALKAARLAVQRSRESAGEQAKQQYDHAVKIAQEAKQALHDHREQLKKDILGIQLRQENQQEEYLVALNATLARIHQAETDAEKKHKAQSQQIEMERLAKLKDNGVDTMVLRELELQIGEGSEKLTLIDSSRNLVAEWRLWRESEWSMKATIERSINIASQHKARISSEKNELSKGWFKDQNQRKQSIQTLTNAIDIIEKELSHIALQRQVLADFPPNLVAYPEHIAHLTLQVLVEQVNNQRKNLDKHEEILKREITALKRVFSNTRNSPADQYYESRRKEIGPDRAEHPREWVPIFRDWYQTIHKECHRLLHIDARTIADLVGDFRDKMTMFHSKVQQFNRELQDNINANQGFKSIGGLTVEIVSSIRELEYWTTVDKLADSRLEWLAGNQTNLPPPEFALALRELLDHWQLKEGIQAELTHLVRIQGEVIENGKRRPFKKAEDLEHISSNGLSYIVMVLLFMAFINRVRGNSAINIVWALDEIGSLDTGNTVTLVNILKKNNITLVTACPDPKPDVLATFRNRRAISSDRRIYEPTPSNISPKHISSATKENSYV
ncbi:ATP-binding protein [Chitinibacter tainanensis]|uniref:ATP-binding protein n=1 Tax=Chitinibacter tainanensis TaxID=230667 RepID=UPI000429199C|nr:ATP-binding protein [Chitinibacter tainanensis]